MRLLGGDRTEGNVKKPLLKRVVVTGERKQRNWREPMMREKKIKPAHHKGKGNHTEASLPGR